MATWPGSGSGTGFALDLLASQVRCRREPHWLRGQLGWRHPHLVHFRRRSAGGRRGDRLLHHDLTPADGKPDSGGPIRRSGARYLRLRQRGDRPRRPARPAGTRPTLLATATLDFFPIAGARETFAEAKHLFEVAGAGDRIERAEANERHGLSLPLRKAVYGWFDRWLRQRHAPGPVEEIAITPRPAAELRVCAEGQVNRTFHSQPLLPLALDEFDRQPKQARKPLTELLGLDPELADPRVDELGRGAGPITTVVLCVNGNEAADWRKQADLIPELTRAGYAVFVVDPRGVGRSRPKLAIMGLDYANPISGVEENIAYNAFLVGKSLVGMRVTDVLAAVRKLQGELKPQRFCVCGRRDAALVAALAAAVEPSITHLAAEELRLSLRALFTATGTPINAASILPGLLAHYGDVPEILAQIAPRRVLISAGVGDSLDAGPSLQNMKAQFSGNMRLLTDWLAR